MPLAWAIRVALPLVLLQAPAPDVPRAHATLYDKPPQQSDSGEPRITVGVLTGAREVRLRASGAVRATWHDADGTHRRVLPGPVQLQVDLAEGHPAQQRWLVPLSDDKALTQQDLPQLLQRWALLGVAAFWQPSGAPYPLLHEPQDLRRVRLVTPVTHELAGAALSARLMQDHPEVQAPELQRLSYPRGTLRLTAGDAAHPAGQLGALAQDIVSLEAEDGDGGNGALQVLQVPYGAGYVWAGEEDRSYRGVLHLLVGTDGALTVVNDLPMEIYLRGVVAAEMPPAAPQEALRAQATAARSHVLHALGHRHRDMPFHFCAEQHCQVYGGQGAEDGRTDAAVQSTQGAVLVAQGQVVRALFSADCGGRTENNDVPWPQAPDPQLRSVADGAAARRADWQNDADLELYLLDPKGSFCGRSTARGGKRPWRRTLSCAQLQDLWRPHVDRCGALQRLVPGPRGPGGRLVSLTFEGSHGSHTVHRELPIRALLGGLPSAALVLRPQDDLPCAATGGIGAQEVIGTGWGHGVGLCQQGTMGRARAGQSAAQILSHYYGGATVRRLWNTGAEP